MYAEDATDSIGDAIDGARRCERLAATLEVVRSTARDLDDEIEREVARILEHLHITRTLHASTVRRLLRMLHTLARGSPGDGGADGGAPCDAPDGGHHLAAYGLGPFELLVKGVPVRRWESLRGQAVLKVLLIRGGRAVHREELMECLWPGAPYPRARNRLNVSIHGLRRSLDPHAATEFVVFNNESYCLNADIPLWFDVREFQERTRRGRRHQDAGHVEAAMSEFRRAVALYTGDLFADDRYADWAESTRRRLRRHHHELLDALGDVALRTGDLRACLHWSEALLEVEPWHEDAHARLMRVHARRGQPQLAIRQFVECARVLRSEVEAMPGRPVIDLYEQIKRGAHV